jgi:hypothetical protein
MAGQFQKISVSIIHHLIVGRGVFILWTEIATEAWPGNAPIAVTNSLLNEPLETD